MDAGGKAQDILLAVNGVATNVRFPEEMAAVRQRIASLPIGSDVKLTVRRGKETMTLTAKTTRLEGYLGEERAFQQWGASMREVTRPYAVNNQLDQVAGVWITSMSEGEPVERAHLQAGDVILSVDRTPVTDLAQFQKLYDDSLAKKKDRVALEVERERQVFTAILDVKDYAPASEPSE
jgi:serine protease Do